jgi:hypothetical protein
VASCRHRAVYEQKKIPVLPLPPQKSRVQLPGSGATVLIVPHILGKRGILQPAAGLFELAEAGHGLSPSRADAAPWIPQRFAGRVLLTDPSSLLRVQKLRPPEQPGPVAREIASGFGDEQDPASSGEARLGAVLPAPGQPRVAVHEDEDSPAT